MTILHSLFLCLLTNSLPISTAAWSSGQLATNDLRCFRGRRLYPSCGRTTRLWDSERSPPTRPLDAFLANNKDSDGDESAEAALTTSAADPMDVELGIAKSENKILKETILHLEQENQELKRKATGSKIILETFEGEALRPSTEKAKREWYKDASSRKSSSQLPMEDNVVLMEGEEPLWCDELNDGTCPIEPTVSFLDALKDRALWLVGLLAFQSCSGFILARNEALLENHPTIIYFLTMLVGAGGNAGNQASVRVIRGLALGTLNESTQAQFLWRELKMGFALSALLSVAGFCRAAAFRTPLPETVAVTCALSLIVFCSICLGAVLPLLLKRIGIDPAHSSTTIQVVMDILGVVFTVLVSTAILDSAVGELLISRLSF